MTGSNPEETLHSLEMGILRQGSPYLQMQLQQSREREDFLEKALTSVFEKE